MTGLPGAGRLLVATRNPGKLGEIRELAAALGRDPVTLDDVGIAPLPAEDALEVFDTFEANALAKARYYHAASGGLVTLADDSGLEVRALGGAPGVLSRRWAGATGSEAAVSAANNRALLAALRDATDRAARFTCVVAYVDGERELTGRGTVVGRIVEQGRGAGGFGYDPLFSPDELDGRTFGECTRAEKARVSHRARALTALFAALTSPGPGRTLRADGA